jgi:signal transduction histidine kinase
MKLEFLSIVSHELRTPLTAISGALELLSTGLLPFESHRGQQSLQIAATEADRLTRLVNDILDLERLESGKVSLHFQPCNLAELMEQAIENLQIMAEQCHITLCCTPLPVAVYVDKDHILQVLTNLLSNAIKFSDSHHTIWLTAQPRDETNPDSSNHPSKNLTNNNLTSTNGETHQYTDGNYIQVIVRDEGRGIPSNKLDSIFDRFQQVDASDSRQKGGTGLGLAICKSIINQHGGQIWAESTLGQGSEFHFTLPLVFSLI